MSSILARLPAGAKRRLNAHRWLVDAARRTQRAQKSRRQLEGIRSKLLLRNAGGGDEAMEQIVNDALAASSTND